MRLGIVVAVSENVPPLKSLSACKGDGEAMSALIKATGRFDDVLVLTTREETASDNVKSVIGELVDKYKDQSISEVLFYFSGHGEFSGDEFRYVLSDYESKSKRQTSLANTELDGMIRSLKPDLFVKIVDACYSGENYIKSDAELSDYLKAADARFKNVYFLYSSQQSEPSWTAGKLSAFTQSIVETIAGKTAGQVRYRDIIDAVSDSFETSGRQTPHFVTQAKFTEIFCDASPEVQTAVAPFVSAPTPAPIPPSKADDEAPAPAPAKQVSLKQRLVQRDAERSSKEEATAALESLVAKLTKISLPKDAAEIFELKVHASSDEPDSSAGIGEWLSKNTDRGFFARPTYKQEKYMRKVYKDPLHLFNVNRILGLGYDSDQEVKLVESTRSVVSGYTSTAALPYEAISVRLEPKFKSVEPVECVFALIFSDTHCRVFWAAKHFRFADWSVTVPDGRVPKWMSLEAPIKSISELEASLETVVTDTAQGAIKRISSSLPDQ